GGSEAQSVPQEEVPPPPAPGAPTPPIEAQGPLLYTGGFSGALQLSPPPVPPGLLRAGSSKVKDTPGMGKAKGGDHTYFIKILYFLFHIVADRAAESAEVKFRANNDQGRSATQHFLNDVSRRASRAHREGEGDTAAAQRTLNAL
ncbi:hypothetical protein F7725_020087, partial [Dissostichus mawsoni]